MRRLRLWWLSKFGMWTRLREVAYFVDEFRNESGRVTEEFYKSWEFKKVAYDARVKWRRVRRLYCFLCGRGFGEKDDAGKRIKLCVDHIYPVSKFPWLALYPDNLQILDNDCNMGKSNRTYDFRPD